MTKLVEKIEAYLSNVMRDANNPNNDVSMRMYHKGKIDAINAILYFIAYYTKGE